MQGRISSARFLLKAPLVKGGGFGFAKTGGILLKLPAEFNGMGLQSLRHLLRKCHLPLHKGGRYKKTPFRVFF